MGGIGAFGKIGGLGEMDKMGNPGKMGGIGKIGKMGGLGNLGALGSLGSLGGLGTLGGAGYLPTAYATKRYATNSLCDKAPPGYATSPDLCDKAIFDNFRILQDCPTLRGDTGVIWWCEGNAASLSGGESMPYCDRFDICEAYAVLEWDWHVSGWLRERESNQRRREATSVQLSRIGFRPRPNLSYDTLSENGKDIYANLCERYGFDLSCVLD